MKAVISIGGSIIASPTPNLDYIKSFSNLLIRLRKEGYKLGVVTGGGKLARDYIAAARELGTRSDEFLDEIGISATRMNAQLLIAALGEHAYRKIPTDYDCDFKKILVMGGTKPGQTTDAVAAKLAAKCRADLLVIATNVSGVYDSDPKKNPKAKKFDLLTSAQLIKIVGRKYSPGMTGAIDPIAAGVIRRKKMKTIVVDGRNMENIANAIRGGKHGGTVIVQGWAGKRLE